jgi:hypothetical protein
VAVSGPGDFEVWLAPGNYSVAAEPGLPSLSVSPSSITVPADGVLTPTFRVPSGTSKITVPVTD